MESDPLKDLATIERELQREQGRPAIWEAVVAGEVDPQVAAEQRAGADTAAQLALDRVLFRPLAPDVRRRLVDQVLTRTPRRVRSRRVWGVGAAIGLAAAAGLVLYLLDKRPLSERVNRERADLVAELSVDIPASVEIVGGLPGVRGAPARPMVSTGLRPLPVSTSRSFRVQVRVQGRDFELHRVFLHCPRGDDELRFSSLMRQTGFVEADVHPSSLVGEVCRLEVLIREGADIFKLPGPERPIMFTPPP